MDSIHHLSTSLPSTRRRPDNSELLSDFKAAALSVTNLYKSAAASHDRARASGYQDALDELLTFLDQENLGLMDGEGWRVRQWATERLVDDGTQRQRGGSVSGDEADNAPDEQQHTQTRSSSPEVQRKPALPTSSSDIHEETEERRRTALSEPPSRSTPPATTVPHTQPPQIQLQPPVLDNFTFRAQQSYPTNHERENTMEIDLTNNSSAPSSAESVRFLPYTRTVRGRAHATNHARRSGNANGNTTIGVNIGTGSKRKLPYPDFFDISNVNLDGYDWKDDRGGGRGGKRGRFV